MDSDDPRRAWRGDGERLLHVTTDEAFGESLATDLDQEGRVVETTSMPAVARAYLADTWYDALVVDHDGDEVDAAAFLRDVHDAQPVLPVVVCAGPDDGTVASDVLAIRDATFVARDRDGEEAGTVAERVESALSTTGDTAPGAGETPVPAGIAERVLASSDVGFVVSDVDGSVRWVSDAVETFLGVPAPDLVGTPRRRVVRQELADAVADPVALSSSLLGVAGSTQVLVRTDDNTAARWLDCRSTAIDGPPLDGGRVDRFVDVTRFVREDDALRELQQLMMASDVAFAERLHEVLSLGSVHLSLPYAFVTAIDDGTQCILDAVGDHERLQPGDSAQLLETYCRKTLAADGLVAIPDATAAGWDNDPAYATFGLESYIGAPVDIHGDHYGTLCFAGSEAREAFADEEQLFVEFAAAWTGWELERYGSVVG